MNLGPSISRGEIAADGLIEQDINLSFTHARDEMAIFDPKQDTRTRPKG